MANKDVMQPTQVTRYLIVALEREIHRLSTATLRPLGLTPSQAEVLTVLSVRSPLTLNALGERLLCEVGSPSRLVDRMVKGGWIERRPAPHDKRAIWIQATIEGQALMPRIAEAEARVRAELTAFLGADLTHGTSLTHGEVPEASPLAAFNQSLWKALASSPSGKVLRRRNAEGSV